MHPAVPRRRVVVSGNQAAGSNSEASSFSGLLTRVETGHIAMSSADAHHDAKLIMRIEKPSQAGSGAVVHGETAALRNAAV
jgi:hypothetical protein